MLSFTDIVILCVPLAAVILAVMKDTFTEEKPGAKKRITRFGVAALLLALAGFGLSLYSTNQAKKEARYKEVVEEKYRSYIQTALDRELPGAFSKAIKESQDQLNKSVSDAVNNSKDGLEAAIGNATEKSSTEVQSAIQSSGRTVASNLSDAIKGSQERIANTLGTTESKINATIKSAETGISDVVEKSDEKIRKAVTGAVDDSRVRITDVFSQVVEAQTKRIGEMAEKAVGEQIMQIPLRIDQDQSGRLTGPLSDVIITVGDISEDDPFKFIVYHEKGRVLYKEDIQLRNEKGELRKISFTHPETKNSYVLELTFQIQTNRLGTGLDYVVIRAISPVNVARK